MVKLSKELALLLNEMNKEKKICGSFFENQELDTYIFIKYLEELNLVKKKKELLYVS